MTRSLGLSLTLLLLGGGVEVAQSQQSGQWTISNRGQYLFPSGALADIFASAPGFSVTCGQRSSPQWLWEGLIEGARMMKGNEHTLYFKDLSVRLQWLGGGIQGMYYPMGGEGLLNGILNPYLSAQVVAYRWEYDRGAHQVDSAGTARVSEFKQQDWSLGFAFGAGVDVNALPPISVYGQVGYKIIVGDIWPTLALRVEGVSGFQMLEAAAGARLWLDPVRSKIPQQWTVSISATSVRPTRALSNMFRPAYGGAVTVGLRSLPDFAADGLMTTMRLNDESDSGAYSNTLQLFGAGIKGTYYPLGGEGLFGGTARPYLSESVILHRWEFTRSQDGSPVVSQKDWALGLSMGGGVEADLFESASVFGQIIFEAIFARLKPDAVYRLEGVTGFQMFEAGVGIRVRF